jgi:dihydrofolate reductase
MPIFVPSHRPPGPSVANYPLVTYVTDGIESALAQARRAAGHKNVIVIGGANTIQQFLKAGLLDEMHLHIVPVLLGKGIRLFENTGAEHIELEKISVIEAAFVSIACGSTCAISVHDQDPFLKNYRSVPMRRLIVSTFASLDGIMQAPDGPEEDPTGGFTLGGWMFNLSDEVMDLSASGFDGKDRELVLGRRTYEIFEAHWPYQPDDNPIARTLNAARKYVASRTLTTLHWNNSTLLHGV